MNNTKSVIRGLPFKPSIMITIEELSMVYFNQEHDKFIDFGRFVDSYKPFMRVY